MTTSHQELLSPRRRSLTCTGAFSGIFKLKSHIFMAMLLLSAVVLLPGMSFAHNVATGCGSNSDISISDEANWKALCSRTLNLSDGAHDCVATAGAEIANPGGEENQYLFTLDTLNNPLTNSAYERQVELNDNSGVNDPNTQVVSTVRRFSLAAGSYTFYWLARPKSSGDATATIEDYSMGVVCVDGN